MTSDLEHRLRQALREDAAGARLVNPDGPPAPEARRLAGDEDRPRPLKWIAVAAVVALLALVGALTLLDADQNVETVPPATQVPEPVGPTDIRKDPPGLQPGQYFIDPDGDPSTPLRVTFEVAAENWEQWIPVSKITDGPHIMLSITTVTNLTTDACLDPTPKDPPVGPSVDDLATALSQLPPFEVTAPPSDVTFLGYEGKHLELTVPYPEADDSPVEPSFSACQDGFHSWISPLLGSVPAESAHAAYNGPEIGLTEEFWILDAEGTRLVIVANTSPGAPPEWVAERQDIIDSIQIQP
jgi:hypothetical protein